MRKTVYKHFAIWEFDELEKWLNEMADDGFALISARAGTYEFDITEKGEYKICMLLLDKKYNKTKSTEQIEFFEQTGAEFVGAFNKWAFFRKKSELGNFEIYSDKPSKIKHLSRLINFTAGCLTLENILIIANTINITIRLSSFPELISKIIILIGMLGLLIADIVTTYCGSKYIIKLAKKRKELKKQATLFE